MSTPSNKILALDLEGTLISNAMSQIARPGLYEFLCECRELFTRIVMFTAVSEEMFRPIAERLVADGVAPEWFRDIEYVRWSGPTKDLAFVPGAAAGDVVLVDDFEIYVQPGQESQWVQVPLFEYQSGKEDHGLQDILPRLRELAHGRNRRGDGLMERVEENAAIEFHDSILERVEYEGETVVAVLTAYVHRSAGTPGVDAGTGWSQTLQLRFERGRAGGSLDKLPMALLGGYLETTVEQFDNLLPLPFKRVGSVSVELHAWNDQEIDIEGDSVEAVLVGEARYIEDIAVDR